ncbi:MAG TPA: TRAM domain-containing protein [Actinomycetota bacterium]|nr:TRAM domain-containing protein [Actinomycetota bacterium]
MSAEPDQRHPSASRSGRSRGGFVEVVRLILVGLFTAAGWQIAQALDLGGTQLLLAVVLGSLVGYVIGGVLGRRALAAVSEVEREFQRMPASELLAGTIGLILGLVISVLVSLLLFRLPGQAAYPAAALVTIVFAYLGYRAGRAKRDELFGLFGLKTRSFVVRAGEVNVLDTSALIDGRIRDVVEAGFVGGTLLVHRGVLAELQAIADSSEASRRARGQRGLDVLRSLQRNPAVEVVLVDREDVADVDTALVRLAREHGASLVTGDANLAKVAAALDVPARSISQLADVLRTPFLPGEEVTVRLTREGREHGQGVGYLDDGTMVVVEEASHRVGSDVRVTVTNVLQTSSGRMVFARVDEG